MPLELCFSWPGMGLRICILTSLWEMLMWLDGGCTSSTAALGALFSLGFRLHGCGRGHTRQIALQYQRQSTFSPKDSFQPMKGYSHPALPSSSTLFYPFPTASDPESRPFPQTTCFPVWLVFRMAGSVEEPYVPAIVRTKALALSR